VACWYEKVIPDCKKMEARKEMEESKLPYALPTDEKLANV
jgi:hypothetical protein